MTIMFFTACKMYTYKKYHIEKPTSLKTRADYVKHMSSRNLFPLNQVLFIDSASYISFITEKVQQDSSVVYVGSYLNDSIVIKRTDLLNENTSCSSRMLNEIRHNISMKTLPDSILITEKKLSSYKLYHLSDGRPFRFNDNGKIHIILNYTSLIGTYYDDFYKRVMEIQQENSTSTEVYVIILDFLVNR